MCDEREQELVELTIAYILYKIFSLTPDGLMLWNGGFKAKETCKNLYQVKNEYRDLATYNFQDIHNILKRLEKTGIIKKMNPSLLGFNKINTSVCYVVSDSEKFEKQKEIVFQTMTLYEKDDTTSKANIQIQVIKEKLVDNDSKNEKEVIEVSTKEELKLDSLSDVEELLEELSKGPWNSFYRSIRKLFHHVRQLWITVHQIADEHQSMKNELQKLKEENQILKNELGISLQEEEEQQGKFKVYEIDRLAEQTQKIMGVKAVKEEADISMKEKSSEKKVITKISKFMEEKILPNIKKKKDLR